MSLKRTLIRNTTYNLAGYFFLAVASFISVPIILGSLGKNLYGVLVLFSSFIPLLSTADLGLSPAVIRELSLPQRTLEEKRQIWRTSFFLFLGLGFVGIGITLGVFLGIFRHWPALESVDFYQLRLAVIILSLTLFFDYLTAHLLTLPQADQRFDVYNLRTLLVGTGNTLGTAVVAYLTRDLVLILAFRLLLYLVTSWSLLRYARESLHSVAIWPQWQQALVKRLLHFGVRNFLGKVSNQVANQFSNYAVGGFLSAGAVAAFNIPQNLVIKAAGAISQATLAFFPMSAQLSSRDRIQKLKRLVVGVQGIILWVGVIEVLFVYFLGERFLLWWLKDTSFVMQAYPVFRILSWHFLLTTLTPIPTAVLNSLNYPQIPSFFALLTGLATIILTLWLTPMLGVTGPAYAAVLSSFVMVPLFLGVFSFMFVKYQPPE